MGYTKVKFRQCNVSDYIMTLDKEKKIEDVVKECNNRPKCTGIYIKNCRSNDTDKILCKGKPEYVTKEDPNGCFWIRSKYNKSSLNQKDYLTDNFKSIPDNHILFLCLYKNASMIPTAPQKHLFVKSVNAMVCFVTILISKLAIKIMSIFLPK